MADPKKYWSDKAEKLKKEGKFEEAIKILDKIQEIKKTEKQDDFWYKKGLHLCEIGEYEQARDALNKDIEKNQRSYNSFFLMGKILYHLKEYEKSLECYNKASEEYNRKHMKNIHKVDHMKNANKFEEAVKYSDLVYREKDLSEEFWYSKGKTLVSLRKYDEALSCFKNILKENPKNSKALYESAKLELQIGNKQKALDILETACFLESLIREKLRVDKDFEQISDEKRFREIAGLLKS